MKSLFLFLFTTVILSLTSCNNDSKPNPITIVAPSITSTQDNSQIQSDFDDMNRIVQLAFESAKVGETGVVDSSYLDCYTIKINTSAQTAQILFDSTKLCSDGKLRKGRFDVTYTGAYRTQGTVITTTLVNYSVNGVKFEGTKTVTNKGNNTSGNLEFEIIVANGKRTTLTNVITTWESTRTREWIEGESTLDVTDDVYLIYGTANGNNSSGQSYNVLINKTEALRLDINCWLTTRLPVSGIIRVTPNGEDERAVNYGDGTCDKKLSVEYQGNTFSIISG